MLSFLEFDCVVSNKIRTPIEHQAKTPGNLPGV